MHVSVYSQLRCCAPILFPLCGTTTSVVKAAIPSCEFDLCCWGSSAWTQCWPRELGWGFLCALTCSGVLMIAWYPVQVFMGFYLVGWFCSCYQENYRMFALSSKRLSASRLVRKKLLSVTSFWQRGCLLLPARR